MLPPAAPPLSDKEEVEEFISNVDEISRLIDGLKAGTISPEYIDSKQAQKQASKAQSKAPAALPAPKAPSKQASSGQPDAKGQEDADEAAKEEEEVRKERVMQKVQELKVNYERKMKARQKYEEYLRVKEGAANTEYGTDYTKWDMWCPEDEEDDLINSCTPNNPAFRAMEKDINERHERMVEQRQIAERQRVAGNEAFKAGQYSEALRCYQLGLEAQKTNMALHANAAQAALKLSCFVQAIEHCDKALQIADFFHNNKNDPLCAKAHMRRATAYRALAQYDRAVQDLEEAVAIEPNNKELTQLLAKAKHDLEEHRKQKAVRKALKISDAAAGAGAGSNAAAGSSGLAIDVEKLRKVEQLVQCIKQGGSDAASGGEAKAPQHGPKLPSLPPRKQGAAGAKEQQQGAGHPAVELKGLLDNDDACCVYFRECGGITAVGDLVSGGSCAAADLPACFDLLNMACLNDGNLLAISEHSKLVGCVVAHLSPDNLPLAAAAARLLCTLVVVDEARKRVSSQIGTEKALGQVVRLLAVKGQETVQAVVLSLLANCMVDEPCKAAMLQLLSKLDSSKESSNSAGAAACLQQLVASSSPVVSERALTLLANMCGSPSLRTALQTAPALLAAVITALVSHSKGSGSAAADCTVAAATALYNLSVDGPAQEAVASSGKMAHLISLISASAGSGSSSPTLIARVTGVLARCAKSPAAAQLLVSMKGVEALCSLTGRLLDRLASQGGSGQGQLKGEEASTLDSAVRALTVLAADEASAAGPALVSAGGVPLLVCVLSTPGVADSVLGNAALCVASLAKQVQHLPALRAHILPPRDEDDEASPLSAADAQACLVSALLRVAHAGQGSTVSKNAAIALARMAQDPPTLARLKSLRGLEVMYAYARPS